MCSLAGRALKAVQPVFWTDLRQIPLQLPTQALLSEACPKPGQGQDPRGPLWLPPFLGALRRKAGNLFSPGRNFPPGEIRFSIPSNDEQIKVPGQPQREAGQAICWAGRGSLDEGGGFASVESREPQVAPSSKVLARS